MCDKNRSFGYTAAKFAIFLQTAKFSVNYFFKFSKFTTNIKLPHITVNMRESILE